MSLLLDALKKAAEQKAAKEKGAAKQPVRTADETIVMDHTRTEVDNTVAFNEDRTEYREGEAVYVNLDRSESKDKAEVVDTTVLTQFEVDKTEILGHEVTEVLGGYDATQIVEQQASDGQNASDSGKAVLGYEEDAAIAFTKPDNSEPEDKTKGVDTTELTQFEEDKTEILGHEVTEVLGGYDATEIVEQRASDGQNASDSDETVDSMGVIDAAYLARINRTGPEVLTDDDVTAFMGEHYLPVKSPAGLDSDVTLETTALSGDQQSDGAVESEDMSLTLMEMDDPISPQAQGSDETAAQITDSLITDWQITDSQITDTQVIDAEVIDAELQARAQNSGSTEEGLNLVDIPEDKPSSNDTITNRLVAFGGLTNEETVARHDSTSTQTYAPDNYDRTLIKIDHDDVSQLFVGMKSESDVLMTPDYAKKVFISNSSAQRFNHYKIYSGIAAAILLFIVILGLFEYEEESINIDNSLRALKRDPMPNLSKRSVVQTQAGLFAQTDSAGVDTKTLALVENAGDSLDVAAQTAEVIADDDAEVSGIIKSNGVALDEKDAVQAVAKNRPDSSKVKATSTTKAVAKTTQKEVLAQSQSLQLSSKRSFTEKDTLLKDAYAAYQRGDNNTALEKYNRVLADDSQNRNALLARAAINVQNDKTADAIRDYQALLIANPKDSLAMSSLISVASISPSKSESQLKGMIRDEPSSPHLNFALANVYGAQNRWQEAQNLYFKALENNPNDPNYAYNLAVSLEHISKPKVAITYYQRALVNFNNGLATFSQAVVDQRVEMLKQL
jgi:tetratricopeptide (TPR) repeat protein